MRAPAAEPTAHQRSTRAGDCGAAACIAAQEHSCSLFEAVLSAQAACEEVRRRPMHWLGHYEGAGVRGGELLPPAPQPRPPAQQPHQACPATPCPGRGRSMRIPRHSRVWAAPAHGTQPSQSGHQSCTRHWQGMGSGSRVGWAQCNSTHSSTRPCRPPQPTADCTLCPTCKERSRGKGSLMPAPARTAAKNNQPCNACSPPLPVPCIPH